jgi:IMP dehydrogenase
MQIAEVMTPRSAVVTVEVPGTREDALEYLQERAFSSLPVIKQTDEGEQFRGLVSREALIETPDEDQLALLMDDEVPTVAADDEVETACRLMTETDQRRLPVVDGVLEGIVTVTDVVRAVAEGDIEGSVTADALARRDVNTTYIATPLSVVERELFYANVPYAVVLDDDGDMTGIVTEVDVLDVAEIVESEEDTGGSIASQDDEWMWEGIKTVGNRYLPTRNVEIPTDPVGEFMTEDVVTVGRTETAERIAQLLIGSEIEQVPLVSGSALVGIVRDVDLVGGLYE